MPDLIDLLQRLKNIASNEDEKVLKRLASVYDDGFKQKIEPQINALVEQVQALSDSGNLTREAVKKSATYRNLITSITEELDDYTVYLRTEVRKTITESASRGISAEKEILLAAIAASLGVEVKGLPRNIVAIPNEKALDFLSAYLDPSGKLYETINGLSGFHAGEIASGILERVAQGQNPLVVGQWISKQYSVALSDSLRICRTTQIYSYRKANHVTMRENSDVLQGWIWHAELDSDTCSSCIAMHGTVHSLDEELDDHYNGRCVPLPWVKGADNPIEQTGEQWFRGLDYDEQTKILGVGAVNAWRDGVVEFSQFSTTYDNDVFGEMRGTNSLLNILGEEAKEYYSPDYRSQPGVLKGGG